MAEDKFERWAVVELFGHSRIAGLVSESTIGGCAFIRVDVPAENGGAGFEFTRYLGQGAIYAINIVDELVAREAAKRFRVRPDMGFTLPQLAQQPLLDTEEEPFEDDPFAGHDDIKGAA